MIKNDAKNDALNRLSAWLIETPFPNDSRKIIAKTLKKICELQEERS